MQFCFHIAKTIKNPGLSDFEVKQSLWAGFKSLYLLYNLHDLLSVGLQDIDATAEG